MDCEIVQDLLPLYHDGVCSDSSKKMVEKHLKSCEVCREELRLMDENFEMSHLNITEKNQAKAAEQAWKRGKMKALFKGGLVVLLVMLVLGSGFVVNRWFSTVEEGDLEEVGKQITLGRKITFTTKETKKRNDCLATLCLDEENQWYVCIYVPDEVFNNRWKLKIAKSIADNEIGISAYKKTEEEIFYVVYGINLPKYVLNGSSVTIPEGTVQYHETIYDTILDIYEDRQYAEIKLEMAEMEFNIKAKTQYFVIQ